MKIKTKTLFENIVAICIILDCESVWKWMHGSGYFRLALTLCFMGSLMALLLRDGAVVRYGSKNRAIFMGFYLSFLVIYNVAINSAHVMDVFQLALTLALMLLFFNNEENIRDVMQRCSKILCFLAAVSLFFWLFGSILHVFNPSQELTIYVSDVPRVKQSYFFLQYEMQKEEILGASGIWRNTGFFYEGPKYVLLLSLMLAYELFIARSTSFKRCIIFSITALSTMSMTGVYAIGLIWILYLFVRYPAGSNRGLIFRVLLVLVLFGIGTQVASYFESTFTLKASTASYSTRMDNYQAGFAAWLEKPILGSGYLNMTNVIAHYSSFRLNDIGYSNSIFRVLAQGGIYLALIYVVPMLKSIQEAIITRNSKKVGFLFFFLYYFITTSFPYNYICYMVLFILFFCKNDAGEYSVR